jgi:protein-disulfide isomerase
MISRTIIAFSLVLLTACASTQPRSIAQYETAVASPPPLPTVTPTPMSSPTAVATEPAASSPEAAPVEATAVASAMDDKGLVTPSMAELHLSGEEFSTLGDPEAPITMVEFSDFG